MAFLRFFCCNKSKVVPQDGPNAAVNTDVNKPATQNMDFVAKTKQANKGKAQEISQNKPSQVASRNRVFTFSDRDIQISELSAIGREIIHYNELSVSHHQRSNSIAIAQTPKANG